jgi:CrcB protein
MSPASVGLVALGGAVGTAARYGIGQAWGGAEGSWPWATFVVNVTGALALGVVLGLLGRLGRAGHGEAESERGRRVRLAVGVGLLGGYTTYSAFGVEVASLLSAGHLGLGLAYAAASVVAGAGAAWAGLRLGGGR